MPLKRTTLARLGALIMCLGCIAVPAAADDTNAALRYWSAWSMTSANIAEVWAGVPRTDFGDPDATFDEAALELLNQHTHTISAMRRAAALERCDFGMEWELGLEALLPHLSKVRSGANLLMAHARINFDNGDAAEGARSLSAAIRLAEQCSQDGTLISSLVSAAVFAQCEKLIVYVHGRGVLHGDVRRTLTDAIGAFPASDPFRTGISIANERTHFIGWIKRKAKSDDRAELLQLFDTEIEPGSMPDGGRARIAAAVMTGDGLDKMLAGLDECMALIVDAWSLPDPAVVITPLMEEITRGAYGEMAAALTTSYPRLIEQRKRAEALLANARNVVAAR